ncbi:MAG: hypothetical protein PHP57_13805, partial [Sideroxydans sp.]|nr:hypothetical protein [Sideroxydans sp.]
MGAGIFVGIWGKRIAQTYDWRGLQGMIQWHLSPPNKKLQLEAGVFLFGAVQPDDQLLSVNSCFSIHSEKTT